MSKRSQDTQGGEERYGFTNNGPGDMADRPQQANAAQMARRKIAQVKKSGASARSSRANTPTANPFASQQQSMPSFQLPQQGGEDGGGFNFSVNAPSNPFQNANGASATPPPSFGMNQQQQNGGGGIFGNNSTSFGSTFGSNPTTKPQSNGFSFGQNNNTNGNRVGFSFGQNNQTQQNGAGTTASNPFNFGQTNGTGSTSFQFGQSQQQTPSTQAPSFGSFGQTAQTNGEKSAQSFGGFGLSTQQQGSDKPATPSFSFAQNAQKPAEKPATLPLGLFGQSAQQPQTNGNSGSLFGATSQAEQTSKPGSGGLFTFNSQSQGIGSESTADAASKPAETPKAPTGNLFSAQQGTGKGLFGSAPQSRESSATPKPGESIFSTQNKPKLGGNLFTSDMAEGKKPESPAPLFGQQAQQNGQKTGTEAEQTPKPSNLFGGLGQSQAKTSNDTPKPSSNLFSASSFGQTPAQPSAPPKSMFGQSVQDTNMNTPGSTTQKSSLFAPATFQQTGAAGEQAAVDDEGAPKRSLFDRISSARDTPPPEKEAGEQTSGEAEVRPPSNPFGASAAPSTAQKPALSSSSNLFNASAGQSTPSTNIFSKPAERPPSRSILKAPSPNAQASQSAAAFQPPANAKIHRSASTLADVIPEDERQTIKVLNEGLMAHLAKQNPNADWTTIMEYYLKQAAIIRHKPAPNLKALSAASAKPIPSSAAEDTAQLKKPTPFVRPQQSASSESTSNIFGSAPKAPSLFQGTGSAFSQQTPKPFSQQPPSTAPVNRKRSAEDEAERPPATEKRARPAESTEYPKLPDNASDVSKMFFNALENKNSGSTLFSPKSPPPENNTADQTKANNAHAAAAQLKPFNDGLHPPAGGFAPKTSVFMPSVPSGGSNNFLAAFGKKANEQQEKDRQRRKDEDYDSDEETYEQWAERDRKAQEAKTAKALEDAKSGSGFVFNAATPRSPPTDPRESPEKPALEQRKGSDQSGKDRSAVNGQSKSLFDGMPKSTSTSNDSPSLFSAQTPAKAPASNIFGSSAGASKFGTGSSLFGHLARSTSQDYSKAADSSDKGETVEKQTQGSGDNTWKQSTPIKFGNSTSAETGSTTPAAPPPSFGNLFGPKSASNSTGLLNVPSAKPAMGFNFGAQPASVNDSRATTPGVTTDGEGTGASTAGDADNEPSDNPPADEPQVEDMTGLNPEEMVGETLLHSVPMAKASKWDEKKDDDSGSMTNGWVDKGKGPLYLLKNNATGKVRILLKVPPYGAAKMNFPPLKGGGYEVQGKMGKQMTGTFWDHLAEKPGLGKWLVQVGKKEDAEEISKGLKEGMPE